ncbi:RHS repeat domain-containing protein, partial [Pseudomonas monteilii]
RDTGSLIGSEEFRYDPAANRLDFNARQFDKVKDNRIKQWRDQEYRYDPWGNLIEKRSGHSKVQHFSYDCENRLVQAETLVNGKLESQGEYRYDSLGRRIAKQAEINGEVEQKRFLWQGLRMLREETPGQSILYLYEPGSYAPLARVDQVEGEGQKVYYFHTDQIGTPLELTDSEGKIVWQATYRSWGAIEQLVVDKVEQNLRFQGQYFDYESGLHYNTFRYYDPEAGRFATQDPIGLAGGLNLYFYTLNPINWIDPWGWSGVDGSGRPLSSSQYSVWTSVEMPQEIHSLNRGAHFKYANEELYNRTLQYPELKAALPAEVVEHIQPGPRGGFSDRSPPNHSWHHNAQSPKDIELIPRAQHQAKGPVQASLHPNQKGGFKALQNTSC